MIKINSILSVFYTLIVLLSQYSIFGKDISFIFLFICSIYLFLKNYTIKYNLSFLYFCFSCFFINLFVHFLFFDNSQLGVSIILYTVIIIILSQYLKENIIYRSFKLLGSIAIIGILYHSFLINIMGKVVHPIFIFPINNHANWAMESNRPCSFFTEPQSFCSFIIPFLFLALKRNNIYWAIVITLSVFLSTSSQGVIMAAILWICYLIMSHVKRKYKIGVITLIVIMSVLLLYSSLFEFARNKLFDINIVSDFRVARGWVIYSLLPLNEQLYGIGLQNLQDYLLNNAYIFDNNIVVGNIYSYDTSVNFLSGITSVLIRYGVIGFSFFVILFINLLRKSEPANKPFIIVTLAAFFSQSFNFNAWFLYFFILIFCLEGYNIRIVKKTNFQLRINKSYL